MTSYDAYGEWMSSRPRASLGRILHDLGSTVLDVAASPGELDAEVTGVHTAERPVALHVCGEGLKDRAKLARGTSGSGPFTLTQAAPGDQYTFKARRDYAWGPNGATGKDLPEQVVLKVVPNEQTAANLLVAGSINGASFYGPDRARLEATPGITKVNLPVGNGQFFYHQGDDRPAKDPAVRTALTQAINLQELSGTASSGTGRPPAAWSSTPAPARATP